MKKSLCGLLLGLNLFSSNIYSNENPIVSIDFIAKDTNIIPVLYLTQKSLLDKENKENFNEIFKYTQDNFTKAQKVVCNNLEFDCEFKNNRYFTFIFEDKYKENTTFSIGHNTNKIQGSYQRIEKTSKRLDGSFTTKLKLFHEILHAKSWEGGNFEEDKDLREMYSHMGEYYLLKLEGHNADMYMDLYKGKKRYDGLKKAKDITEKYGFETLENFFKIYANSKEVGENRFSKSIKDAAIESQNLSQSKQ